jgi:hypothetical protein
MIISSWRGFEIDSSEGYYSFDSGTKAADEGWDFMLRLLASPLVWDRIAFDLSPVEGGEDKVKNRLRAVLDRGLPQEHQPVSEYCQLRYVANVSTYLGLVKALKLSVALLQINFCLRPFGEMPVDELDKLKAWFFKQFSDKKEAQRRWRSYSQVRPNDFMLRGHSEMTDEWADTYAFEALFELKLTAPASYGMSISAGDPSLVMYLLATLTPHYDLEYVGDHWISINRQPDKLDLGASPESDE